MNDDEELGRAPAPEFDRRAFWCRFLKPRTVASYRKIPGYDKPQLVWYIGATTAEAAIRTLTECF